MYKFRQIFMMDLLNLFTNPIWVCYSIGLPLGLVLILGILGSGSYGTTVTSYDYYGVALMIYGVFLNATTISANSFMEERIKSANMRVVYSPVRPFNIHFSKVLSSFVFCSVTCAVTALILRLIVGVNYGGTHFWAPLIIMLLTVFFFSALGVLICCILKNESIANNILSLVVTVFAFLGGIFFPVDGLGKAISAASWISPAKWILTTCLRIIYDKDFSLFLPACGILVILSIVSVALCSKLFRGEEYV